VIPNGTVVCIGSLLVTWPFAGPSTCPTCRNTGSPLQMSAILLVLRADIFKEIVVGYQLQSRLEGERPRVVFRIVEGDLQIHVAKIPPVVALGDVHGLAARMAGSVKPGPVVETARVDYKCIAFPVPHGISPPGRD